MRRFHQTALIRSCIVIALIASLLITIGCSSFVPFMREEGSFERAAEKLAVSDDCVVAMKTGEQYRFVQQKAEIITVDDTRWIKGVKDSLRLPMAEVESITPDMDLVIGLADTALVEFPAGRWKFLVREGFMHLITGTGVRTGNVSEWQHSGIFTVSLSGVSDMEVREMDAGTTILLVLGLGLLGLLVADPLALSSMSFRPPLP